MATDAATADLTKFFWRCLGTTTGTTDTNWLDCKCGCGGGEDCPNNQPESKGERR